MAFFKFPWRGRQEQEDPPARRTRSAAAPAQSIETIRQRARHRLMGAAVLVLIGVVGFPMLFDSRPRPIPVDIPIEIPDRNKVAALDEVTPAEQGLDVGEEVVPAAPAVPVPPIPAPPAAPLVPPVPTMRSVAPSPAASAVP